MKDTAVVFSQDGRYYVGNILAPHYNDCKHTEVAIYTAMECPFCRASPMNIPKQFHYDKFDLPKPEGKMLEEFCSENGIPYPSATN